MFRLQERVSQAQYNIKFDHRFDNNPKTSDNLMNFRFPAWRYKPRMKACNIGISVSQNAAETDQISNRLLAFRV